MKLFWNIFLVLALMAGACAGGYFLGHRGTSTPAADDSGDDIQPTPTVQTAPIRQGRIDRKITAYGAVAVPSADVSVLSVAYEARVKKVLAAAGQRVEAGTPLIEIEPSSDTQLEMVQAKAALESASQDLQQTKSRYSSHLATNQDLLQSEQNMQIAKLKLDSLQAEGAGAPTQLKAMRDGLITRVDTQEGQVVPAGSALVEIAADGAMQVRLGVEPSDAPLIHPGDHVALSDLNDNAPSLDGTVQMVSRRIDPDTRMVDVMVALPANSSLPLDDYLRGEFSIPGSDGLIVPATAVLPGDEGYSIFTVEQGKAVEHKVSVAVRNDESVQISGENLSVGQMAVITGNLELEDGMSVKAQTDQLTSGRVGADEAAAAEADK
jgi:membrane fusion protein, multidrug efflux system